MGLFNKNDEKKKHKFRLLINHVEGLNVFNFQEDLNLMLDLEENTLIFESVMDSKKKPNVKLSFDKINYINETTDKEIIEKDKSVVGRAAVGTLLAGPLGAVIGGISGAGSKKETKETQIITIGYNDDKKIILIEGKYTHGIDVFFSELRKYITQGRVMNDGSIEL